MSIKTPSYKHYFWTTRGRRTRECLVIYLDLVTLLALKRKGIFSHKRPDKYLKYFQPCTVLSVLFHKTLADCLCLTARLSDRFSCVPVCNLSKKSGLPEDCVEHGSCCKSILILMLQSNVSMRATRLLSQTPPSKDLSANENKQISWQVPQSFQSLYFCILTRSMTFLQTKIFVQKC